MPYLRSISTEISDSCRTDSSDSVLCVCFLRVVHGTSHNRIISCRHNNFDLSIQHKSFTANKDRVILAQNVKKYR